jgi:hypothetical protein
VQKPGQSRTAGASEAIGAAWAAFPAGRFAHYDPHSSGGSNLSHTAGGPGEPHNTPDPGTKARGQKHPLRSFRSTGPQGPPGTAVTANWLKTGFFHYYRPQADLIGPIKSMGI